MFVRWSVVNGARQVGLARASYEFALEYTQERKAFGKPVAHFQSIAFTLAYMLTQLPVFQHESEMMLMIMPTPAAPNAQPQPYWLRRMAATKLHTKAPMLMPM